MNYQELVAAVKGYLENDFPDFLDADGAAEFSTAEQLETFVKQAEERIYNVVQIPALRRNSLGTAIAGDKYIGLPLDFLAVFSIAVIMEDGVQHYLMNKDVSFIREAYPNPNYTSRPKHYAIFDHNTLIVGPTPDNTYGLEMHYYYYPPSIADIGTSWLGDNFETVLLYGTLVEAYTHMKGEQDLIGLYTTRYTEALALLKRLGDGLDKRDDYRSGQVRIPVQ